MKHIFISTAIPYVNAAPHVGHALEFIEADFFARCWRARNCDVYFTTGTDDNSLKNVLAAEKVGQEVDTYVATHAQEFRDMCVSLNISYTDFIRTREERHILGAQKLWSLCKSEDIYKKQYQGLYCVGCEQFYKEDELVNGVCPDHKTKPDLIEEENYFFKLSNYQKEIERLIEIDEIRIVPEHRKNEVLAFVRRGLEDFSISRSVARAKNWGIPVPGDSSQVMYVWFDALSNYINALDFVHESDAYMRFWRNPDNSIHVIGKGIIRFHAVYWPAMLLSASQALPRTLFVHDYVTIEGQKMSKSIGNVVDPRDLVVRFGSDAVRYYFLREIPEFQDGDYSEARMKERYNELANRLGNLVSRITVMVQKYYPDTFPQAYKDTKANLLGQASEKVLEKELHGYLSNFEIRSYIDEIWKMVEASNKYIEDEKPWELAKTKTDKLDQVLSDLIYTLRIITQLIEPVLPVTSGKIKTLFTETTLKTGEILFPRLEEK